jgi:uncharacterized BrkB/YihY/UPF0761 family membrane protein
MSNGGVRALGYAGILSIVAVAGLGALQAQESTLPTDSPARGFLELQSFALGTGLGTLVFIVVALAAGGLALGVVAGALRRRGGIGR